MSELVSVIVPIYNGKKHIRNCVKCLCNQTYKPLEVIFINDGSTDETEDILKKMFVELESRDIKYKYLTESNAGAAAAVNKALKEVSGKYLMLYDVDDLIMPDCIKMKADFLSQNPEYGMVRNNGYYDKVSNINDNSYLFVRKDSEKAEEYIFESILLGRTNNWSASYMIVTEKLFKHLNNKEIYVSKYGQNMQIMLPVAYHYKCGFIDKPLMRYVNHGKSVSHTNNYSEQLNLMNGFEENRIEIINGLDLCENEKEMWIEKVKRFYMHQRVRFAFQIRNKQMMEEFYRELELFNDIHFVDKWYKFCVQIPLVNTTVIFFNKILGIIDAIIQKIQGITFRKNEYRFDME